MVVSFHFHTYFFSFIPKEPSVNLQRVMFKAGPGINRLSLQRGSTVWFLLKDVSGVQRVSAADSWEIDSWDLSQAEQCWTAGPVIQDTSRTGRGVSAADVQRPTAKCVYVCVGAFSWRPRFFPIIRLAERCSVPADLDLSTTWGPIRCVGWVKFQSKREAIF